MASPKNMEIRTCLKKATQKGYDSKAKAYLHNLVNVQLNTEVAFGLPMVTHCHHVGLLTERFVECNPEFKHGLCGEHPYVVGYMHDIGKVNPLHQSGALILRLKPQFPWGMVKNEHTVKGSFILEDMPVAKEVALRHHAYSVNGYPEDVKKMPLKNRALDRICQVVQILDNTEASSIRYMEACNVTPCAIDRGFFAMVDDDTFDTVLNFMYSEGNKMIHRWGGYKS